jgi:hypothetical protein
LGDVNGEQVCKQAPVCVEQVFDFFFGHAAQELKPLTLLAFEGHS